MATFEIKHRFIEKVLYSGEGENLRKVVEKAVSEITDLRGADLRGANLRGADLQGANLQVADLWGTNLQGADLQGADLREANLREANLREADLRKADLRRANLEQIRLPHFLITPTEGSFTGWKKAKDKDGNAVILKLFIPEDAGRINTPTSRKCRAEFAVVQEIVSADKTKSNTETATSLYDPNFTYKVGETARPDSFDSDIRVECTHGIQFFMTFEEAAEECLFQ
jgi:uncharacterized protein YjbI with pentapeptide repeats